MNRLFAILALVALCAGISSAQNDSLLIGPGDQISVQVLEAPELAQHARVTDSGELPLLLGGEVKIAGLTPDAAAKVIEHALINGDYLLHPHVSVTVDQFATQNVTVLGQVRTPGSYPIGTPRSLLAVLALAGGTTDLADRRITVERRTTKDKVQYFLSNNSDKALDASPRVFPGDTIMVPKIDVVYVMGDVYRPGGYPMATNDGQLSLLQAVTLAGSQQPNAVPNSTRIIRKQTDGTYVQIKVELAKIEKGKLGDVALKPDDIIYIPFSYLRNMGANLAGIVSSASSAAIYRY